MSWVPFIFINVPARVARRTVGAEQRADGTVWTWGYNESLGTNVGLPLQGFTAVPVQVLGPAGTGVLTGIVQIAAEKKIVPADFALKDQTRLPGQ